MKGLRVIIIALILLLSCFAVGCAGEEPSNTEPPHEDAVKYAISVKADNATVTVKEEAEANEEVSFTVEANEGYTVSKVLVNGTENTTKTFVMPAYETLIRVHTTKNVVDSTVGVNITAEKYAHGTVEPQAQATEKGSFVTAYVKANEGYRLKKLYAGGVSLPFVELTNGIYEAIAIPASDIHFTAEFVPIEKITPEYTFSLTAGEAKSYWKFGYGENGLTVNVLVEDDTRIDRNEIPYYNRDNVELQLCPESTEKLGENANALRCLVNVNGRFWLQRLRGESYLPHGDGIGMLIGENVDVDFINCTQNVNGFDGYAVEMFFGYDLWKGTRAELKGKMTFAPAMRNSTAYDAATKKLTSVHENTSPSMVRGDTTDPTAENFFGDEYKCFWHNPSTYIGIEKDGTLFPRFIDGNKNVDILFVGDSYVAERFWMSFREDTSDIKATTIGISSSRIENWNNTRSLSLITELAPKKIFLHMGLNDVNLGGATIDECANGLKALVEALHTVLPDTPITWGAFDPLPKHITKYETTYVPINNQMKTYAADKEWLSVLDTDGFHFNGTELRNGLYRPEDRLHLNAFGYAYWVSRIREHYGYSPLSDTENYGSAGHGAANGGWREENGVLLQRHTLTTGYERMVYAKNKDGINLTATADFAVEEIYNGATSVRFGIIVNNGVDELLFYVVSDSKFTTSKVGVVVRRDGVADESTRQEKRLNVYFTDGENANLNIVKSGGNFTLNVGTYKVLDVTCANLVGEVSTGVFCRALALNVANFNVEVNNG